MSNMGHGAGISILYVGATEAAAERRAQALETADERFRVDAIADEAALSDRLAAGTEDCIVLSGQALDRFGAAFMGGDRSQPTPPVVYHGEDVATVLATDRLADIFTDYVPRTDRDDRIELLAHRIEDVLTPAQPESADQPAESCPVAYQELFDGLDDAVFVHEPDGQFLAVNRTACERLGYTEEELLELRPTDIDAPSEAAAAPERIDRIESEGTLTFETVHETKDGEEIPVEVAAREIEYRDTAAILSVARDLTDRKRRERRLRRFQKASEAAGQAIYITDPDGTIEYVNPAFEAITGYTKAEALGETPQILKSGEMASSYYDALWETIHAGDVWEEEIINRRKDGEIYHAQQTIAPIRDETDEIEGFVAIQGDITELKAKLREVEQLSEFRRVMSEVNQQLVESRDPAAVLPRIAETIASSDQFSRVIVHRPGKEPIVAADPGPAEGPSADFDTVAYLDAVDEAGTLRLDNGTELPFAQDATGSTRAGFGFALRHEGELFGALSVLLPAGEGATGDHLGLLEELAADIGLFLYTRSIEADLREREERLDLALEGAELGVWDWDMASNEVYRDPRYHRMLGYEPDEIGNRVDDWADLLHPEARETHDRALAEHLRGNAELYQCEYRLRTADDEWKWIRNIGKVLEWDDGEPIRAVGVHQDIDEQRRIREQLRSNNELLQAIDRVLRHNLNNKMNVIQGYAATIAANGEGQIRRQAERILESGRALLETTAKERRIMQSVADPQSTEPIHLGPMLDRVVTRLRERYPAATIELETPAHAALAIPGLEGAIEELIENGIEHADKPAPTVTVSVRAEQNAVAVTVEDDGPGLPEMEQNVLTGTEEITPLYHGSGLGLWLINLVVRRSDGSISVTASQAGGSRITIRLPPAP